MPKFGVQKKRLGKGELRKYVTPGGRGRRSGNSVNCDGSGFREWRKTKVRVGGGRVEGT